MLKAFGDESHDPKSERIFAVAAWFGSEDEWDTVKSKWRDRAGGIVFHAADCESDCGVFAGRAHRDNLKLYADLVRILCESRLIGFGSALDLVAYRALFPDCPEDIPYYRCFRDVVLRCGEWAKCSIPQDLVHFTFDQRMESNYNADLLFKYMTDNTGWSASRYIDKTLSFASRIRLRTCWRGS